ncbi:lachesin-like isoform X2 [Stegodyphus dumicola]|uniref:lachesin-like isoform X2 n=1 Tax=Stegodyphus dumicola TaxID=202533 RepID=UPI0015B314BF|nr:lachesin-like isoform X2 [Stegodyphus dumicola]
MGCGHIRISVLSACLLSVKGQPSMPTFAGPVSSLTVAKGRDATLKCVVDNLGSYRVAWVHVDKQTLLTIHTHVITRNKRVSVSHHNFRTWLLHLKNVQQEDSGYYMCQVNTQPMISQVGYLEIVVPPEFVNDVVNRNISVAENANITLSCRATGNPIPKIKWRREDGHPILVGQQKVDLYDGEELNLFKVSRQSMGAYLCIASNGVPPAISRRMHVDITFPPMIWIPNQLVGAPEGDDIALECHTEAHPAATNFWVRSDHVVGTSDDKYETYLIANGYKVHMKLVIKNLNKDDYGVYRCVSKNALGETAGSVNLYKIKATSAFNRNIPLTSPTSDQTVYKVAEIEVETMGNPGIHDNLSLQEEETEISVGHSTGTQVSIMIIPYILINDIPVNVEKIVLILLKLF